MSASAYRYAPRPDRNVDLRQQIVALAQRHRRYGVGMIHLLPGAFEKTRSPAHFGQRIAKRQPFLDIAHKVVALTGGQ